LTSKHDLIACPAGVTTQAAKGVTMTADTPAPGPDAPDSTARPSQAPAAELLNGAALPATAFATATTDPKIPTFVGD
jgi:hypothetical protein